MLVGDLESQLDSRWEEGVRVGGLPGIRARVVVPSQDWALWKVLVPSQVWVGSPTPRSGLGFGVRVGEPSQKLERRFLVGVGIVSHSPLGVGVWNHGSK